MTMQATQGAAPVNGSEAQTIKIQDVITLTARLAQLLAEEVDLLANMKVAKIESLQQEKLFLISALHAHKKLIDKHPYVVDTIPSQDRQDLQEVVKVFNNILEENHRKLLLAKEVNHKIVEAITSVVAESNRSKSYDDKGINGAAPFETISVTLNQTI
jgi:hypothetical protein